MLLPVIEVVISCVIHSTTFRNALDGLSFFVVAIFYPVHYSCPFLATAFKYWLNIEKNKLNCPLLFLHLIFEQLYFILYSSFYIFSISISSYIIATQRRKHRKVAACLRRRIITSSTVYFIKSTWRVPYYWNNVCTWIY